MNWLAQLYVRVRRQHPDNVTIAKGMAWVTVLVSLGAIAHAGREVLIAYHFGSSAAADAYIFLFNLLKWPTGIWLSILTVVLVPLISSAEHNNQIKRFKAELFGLSLILGIGLTSIALIGLPSLIEQKIIRLPSPTDKIAIDLAYSLAVLGAIGIMIGTLSVLSMINGQHTNTLLEASPSAILILFILLSPTIDSRTLVTGTIIGAIGHLALLSAVLVSRKDIEIPRYSFKSTYWPTFWHSIGIVFGGQLLLATTTLADQFIAASLTTGTVSALNYATRLHAVALGIGTIAVSRATIPIFSKYKDTEDKHLRSLVSKWSGLLFFIGLLSAVIGWAAGPEIVETLFERGAFNATDTQNVATIFRYGLPQLPFYFSALLFVSYLSSRRLYIWIFWSGALGLLIKLIANEIFTQTHGAAGITIATSCMYAGNFLFLMFAYSKTTSKLQK